MGESEGRSGASAETRRVIHELRQPLAALQVWVDLLAESLQGQLGEQQERYLAKVRAEVVRIGGVLAASAASPATVSVSAADPGLRSGLGGEGWGACQWRGSLPVRTHVAGRAKRHSARFAPLTGTGGPARRS